MYWCLDLICHNIGTPLKHTIKSHVGIWYALTCKQHGRGFQNLQILLKIAKKLQIGKDYDKKEYEYQKYIDYALKGYQHYGK